MKKLALIFISFLLVTSVMGQEEKDAKKEMDQDIVTDFEYKTLFSGDGVVSHGGYGAYLVGYGVINNLDAFITGGHGSWVIDHRFAIGFGGYGFNTQNKIDPNLGNLEYSFSGGYGGMILEPIIFAGKPIHISIPVFVGVGGVNYHERLLYNYDYNYEDLLYNTEAFFVVEPGIDIEINVVKFFRLALWAKYRFTSDVDMYYAGTADRIAPRYFMQGFSTGVTFKFGKF